MLNEQSHVHKQQPASHQKLLKLTKGRRKLGKNVKRARRSVLNVSNYVASIAQRESVSSLLYGAGMSLEAKFICYHGN
jgi:hypothetical protein